MREIGGYIELDKYNLPMLHEGALALNCGRNALAYLIRAKRIKKIKIPKFLCATVKDVCEKENVAISYYSILENFMPESVSLDADEWLYVVNYYGQLDSAKLESLVKAYKRVVVDNAQAYFQLPIEGVDTLYTCRKFFGVADGAFLYTDVRLDEQLPIDESFERMHFLLGRFERNAAEFYGEYVKNNDLFEKEPLKEMSKLTQNLLHGIDYKAVKQQRTENFIALHKIFEKDNQLCLKVPEGAFMYPFYIENGEQIRKQLQEKKIYVPTLWPDVFDYCNGMELEYDMAKNILPLPCDQRYNEEDMLRIIAEVKKCIS